MSEHRWLETSKAGNVPMLAMVPMAMAAPRSMARWRAVSMEAPRVSGAPVEVWPTTMRA